MTRAAQEQLPGLMANVCEIAAAYVSNNHVPAHDLPNLIATIHASLAQMGSQPQVSESDSEPKPKPTAEQIRKSITPDALISFIDGMPYKTLKRHLTAHGFDPATYRERFGLRADYPMVAPSYSSRRSALAKKIGLGIVLGQGAKNGQSKKFAIKRRAGQTFV